MMTGEPEVCVSVEGVSKKFSRSLKRSFIYGARDIGRVLLGKTEDDTLQTSEFWAVRDISFELRRGQSIGVVGLNGSGKTTLMRMVSGILRPSTGRIKVHGRIAPMLALGAGFKPVLSGRENIFLNLSLLGVSPADIRARFDSIVDFAELWESIDAPIGTYSSGMLARLGFACAVHTDPQILVVDEVLSVGDTRFRIKCRNRINELRKNGTSMLLVSHSAIMIETLSDQCLYLNRGAVAAFGQPAEVMKRYQADVARTSEGSKSVAGATPKQSPEIAVPKKLQKNQPSEKARQLLSITDVQLHQIGSAENLFWTSGQPGRISIQVNTETSIKDASINLMIFDLEHQAGDVVQFIVSSRDIGWLSLKPGRSEIQLNLPVVGLRPSIYRVKLSISHSAMHDILDVVDNLKLVVRNNSLTDNCLYFQPRDWTIDGKQIELQTIVQTDSSIEDAEEF